MRLEPPPLEKSLGLEVYVTETPPVRGRLRVFLEDFIVEEIPRVRFSEEGRYAVYLVEKRGLDAFHAVAVIAEYFRVPRRLIGYSGLKDKRAVARQYMTIPAIRNPPKRLVLAEGRLRLELKGWIDKPLRPGMLLGNRFRITIRHGDTEKPRIREALDEIRELAYLPSFYGHQRFGTRRPNTHIVGRLLVKREFEKAVDNIAGKPYPWESLESRKAREAYDEGRLEEALKLYPKSLVYERRLVSALLRGLSPLEALRSLPRTLLQLYISAYQSYLYNKTLSRRIVFAGGYQTPIPGERVYSGGWRVCPYAMVVPGSNLERIIDPSSVAGDIIFSILREEEVSPRDFEVKELRIRGNAYPRPTCFEVHGLAYRSVPGGTRVEFALSAGMYASIVLREILKQDPLEAGY